MQAANNSSSLRRHACKFCPSQLYSRRAGVKQHYLGKHAEMGEWTDEYSIPIDQKTSAPGDPSSANVDVSAYTSPAANTAEHGDVNSSLAPIMNASAIRVPATSNTQHLDKIISSSPETGAAREIEATQTLTVGTLPSIARTSTVENQHTTEKPRGSFAVNTISRKQPVSSLISLARGSAAKCEYAISLSLGNAKISMLCLPRRKRCALSTPACIRDFSAVLRLRLIHLA